MIQAHLSVVCFGLLVFACPFDPLRTARGETWDLQSDTWVATDALARKLPGYKECGPPRAGKYVGIFYFLWLGQHGTGGPYDITKILAANPTNPQWGPAGAFHHWNESELGYYLSDDEYVMRRHVSMLCDAGIDTLIIDVTNAFTYKSNYLLLCNVLEQAKQAGAQPPQICFIANSSSALVVQTLYNDFYSKNLHPELWFRWQGKPLILASPDGVPATIQSFFTFRQSWAWTNPNGWFGNGQDKWPWLQNCPQEYGWHTAGVPEEVSVSVAQHPTSNIGRSSQDQVEPAQSQWKTAEGPCFAQQWSRALEVDPQFVFVTGWNEWAAQRFIDQNGGQPFLGKPLPAGGTFFVDSYSQEFSRDIEPMKSGHTDNFYYQMINFIRRFKGVRVPDPPGAPKTIVIDGAFADWDDITPEYRDTIGDTAPRSHAGWGSAGHYTNTTGRNDIVAAKVARDDDSVFFYVRTQAPLTSRTDPNWMLLFIDADVNHATGWEGYDYIVNYPTSSINTTTIKRNTGGWNWSTVATVPFAASGNQMELRIPRSAIGQNLTPDVTLDFHWADNIQKTGDIIEFAVSGDSAPNRRFNYRYATDTTPPDPVSGLTPIREASQIRLSWTNPTTPDLAGTLVRYRTDAFPADPADGTLLCDRPASPGAADGYTQPNTIRTRSYYYAAFACDRMQNYSPVSQATAPAILGADLDGDGDVDQSDFAFFQRCISGTAIRWSQEICAWADFNQDGDVDSDDFRSLQSCFSGPGRPATPECLR